ncbi:50S ribosomal protein L11 methyltransferase [Chryseosolibacter indicus]|uniref:Ribosomal protein L11 methyltransferase n=1 Tax=Chryseosolibacter indicus TaxID=2782351 RepID=A0ABS5VSF4_9BACT|nr:50S ribosomal protein L11 methyltransferase [Chryseosolibacter indicus]MBT1704365.1 50S ribosomal protein L11 methyltransferase [Chryseosolibacter indicus]
MFYTKLQVQCNTEFSEILMAELAEIGFDTFLENEDGFEAYVEEARYDAEALEIIKGKYADLTPIGFSFENIEKKNWNEEWEKSYEPIIVDDRCLIRADFHKIEKKYPYEIVITPKMSFGTGHHQTTYLMIKNQMDIDHKYRSVMDAGCGTAILSIMAEKLGAKRVTAFDIDEWSVINGNENLQINNCRVIEIQQGKISEVSINGKFDIILANINKNVLLDEIKTYSTYLNPLGLLLLSGFYTHDIDNLLQEASKYNFKELRRDEKEKWACLLLQLIGE